MSILEYNKDELKGDIESWKIPTNNPNEIQLATLISDKDKQSNITWIEYHNQIIGKIEGSWAYLFLKIKIFKDKNKIKIQFCTYNKDLLKEYGIKMIVIILLLFIVWLKLIIYLLK